METALDGHVKDIDINLENGALPITTDSVGPFSTFTFAGNPFLIQREGIFQLDGLTDLHEGEGQAVSLVNKGSWNLEENEIVLNVSFLKKQSPNNIIIRVRISKKKHLN